MKKLLEAFKHTKDMVFTVWTDNLDDAEAFWRIACIGDKWNVKEPIKVKFDWKRLKSRYRFKLIKKDSLSEK
jgi:hypothetical protein